MRKESEEFTAETNRISEENKVNIYPVYADFSQEEEVKEAAKTILANKKPIDILVNNIGVSRPLALFAMTKMEAVKEVFQINLFSSMLLTQKISKNMIKAMTTKIRTNIIKQTAIIMPTIILESNYPSST